MTLNQIFRINSLIIPALGFLLNFTLLWLILHRTPKEMWLHSRVLLQTCILDILVLAIMCIAIPYATYIDADGNIVFFLFDGYLIRPLFINDPMYLWWLQLLWHFFLHLDVFAIAVQFIYRYLVLIRSVKITICRYLLFLTVPFICLVLITFGRYFSIIKPLSENSIDVSNLSIDFNENITFIAFELKESTKKIVVLFIMFCYFLTYSIIIFCGRQMVKYVAAHAMNERLKELNKQLTKSLIIIASFPLISQAIFAIFFIGFIFIKVVNTNEGFINYFINSWLPIFNPLATLWTFRPYRDALMAPFKKGTTIVVPLQSTTT